MAEKYRRSRYLASTMFDDRTSVVYNTKNGHLALLDAPAISVLESSKNEDGIEQTEEAKSIVDQLVELSFLVDDQLDELAEVKEDHQLLQNSDEVFAFCIAPTYSCNLRCPYCYEKGHDSANLMMTPEVEDKIVELAKYAYSKRPYRAMEVQWFGGEPLLGSKVIESLSEKLMDFCNNENIAYNADIITNGTNATSDIAEMLASCNVQSALVTIDGPHDMHNARRPDASGADSFASAISGIGNMMLNGIHVTVLMNTDKINDACFEDLKNELQELYGIEPKRAKLNDYQKKFGCDDFCEPAFSLYDHKEFTQMEGERFCSDVHDPEDYRLLMAPGELFCRGQMENYFCIDALGDVYKCDGYMGRNEYVIFNLDDGFDVLDTRTAMVYPFDDDACIECNLVPICKGTCKWERESCADHPCHPLKYTMDDYLHGWVDSIGIDGSILSDLDKNGIAVLY